jgi:hypothetical protein
MAHFPHPDGDARAEARQQHAQKAFARWVADFPAVTTLEVPTPEGTVRAYAGGLSATDPKPLPLMCGGIISLKERCSASGVMRWGNGSRRASSCASRNARRRARVRKVPLRSFADVRGTECRAA